MSLYVSVILVASFILVCLKRAALPLNLIDKPCDRKAHIGSIPLIGGIGIYLTLIVVIIASSPVIVFSDFFIVSTGFIVLLGVLDDKYDLNVSLRLCVQTAISFAIIFYEGHYIKSLGGILGPDSEVSLGLVGIPFTVIAIIAAINAFNMIDGIDGLLASTSGIALIGIALLAGISGRSDIVTICVILLAALTAFFAFNLNIFPFSKTKIFMGDAGSMLIGLVIIWLLVVCTQEVSNTNNHIPFSPVTALYFIAVPLMDMVAIMYRRLKKGGSPFVADRDHIHHIFMRIGATPKVTLLVISTLSLIMMTIGVTFELLNVPQWISLLVFCIFFAAFVHLMQHSWKFIRFINKLLRNKERKK